MGVGEVHINGMKHMQQGAIDSFTILTTRFHSFTDRIRSSAFLSSVIPYSVAISVGKTKKLFADGFTDGIYAQKKSFLLEIYRQNFLSVLSCINDGHYLSENLSVSV